MQPTQFKIDIQKIAKQCAELETIAKKKRWTFSYDEDCDCLYYSPRQVPDGVQPLTFKSDFSLYIDKDSNIEGFFIEYYRSNLASHDDRFKTMKNLFIDQSNSLSVKTEKSHLVEIVVKDILAEIVTNTQKMDNIKLQTAP